jgi:hypothetical protein
MSIEEIEIETAPTDRAASTVTQQKQALANSITFAALALPAHAP